MAEFNFNPGDEVKIRLALEELDGRVLESSDKSVLLLKLKSGYNIGIPRENVLDGKVVRRFKEAEVGKKEKEPKIDKGKKTLGLIITGGTIASKLDSRTGGVKHLTSLEEFKKFYPELFEKYNIVIDNPFMVASESMSWEHWVKIAESCEKFLNDEKISGVVVTHGTDFLGYTASALSFMLGKLNKPVVLTYSQRSIDRASSDAKMNLLCSGVVACSDIAEVVLVGHGTIEDTYCNVMGGTKVRKMHTSRRDAFKVLNSTAIAKVWEDGKIEVLKRYNIRGNCKAELDAVHSDKVALVKFYPGQDADILDFYALKYKGIVVEASGLGHLPVSESKNNWIPKIKKLVREGFVICAAAQTLNGRLNPLVYSNGRELVDAGVIFLEDVLPETAFVKLGFVLGHYGWKVKVKEKMLENFAGEFNEKLGL